MPCVLSQDLVGANNNVQIYFIYSIYVYLQVYSLPPLLHRHDGKAEVVDLPKSYRRCWILRELLADVIISIL